MKKLHLTREQRFEIQAFLKIGIRQAEIARQMGRDRSVISREIKRNKFLQIFITTFSARIPLTPEGGTMVDGHADVWGAMVSPSGLRGTVYGVKMCY